MPAAAGQRRHPGRPFLIERAQRQHGGQAQSSAIGHVPHREDRRLFEPLGDVLSAGTAV
jgi:hypothetical protein